MLGAKISTFSDISKHFSNFFLHMLPEGLEPSGWVEVAAKRLGAVSPKTAERCFQRTGSAFSAEGHFPIIPNPKKWLQP